MPLPAGVRVMPLRAPEPGYSVGLIVNRSRSASTFGRAIMTIGQSLKSTLDTAAYARADGTAKLLGHGAM
jgi:hypothetical protein